MKAKLLPIIICLFALSALAQTKEAEKIDELGYIPCGDFMARLHSVNSRYKDSVESKIYIIYYEGKRGTVSSTWDKKLQKLKTKQLNPRRGDALNRAKAVPLYLEKVYKLPKDKTILIDGGFREEYGIEIWIVPNSAELPKASPTVDTKDIKFRKGKPVKIPDYSKCYDYY